jgi:hypothetical protein
MINWVVVPRQTDNAKEQSAMAAISDERELLVAFSPVTNFADGKLKKL